MSLHLNKSWILLVSLVFLSSWDQGCAIHALPNTIAIVDEPSPPNFSVNPPELIIKAGEEITWSNHTSSVMELSVWLGDGLEKPGLFQRLGSKIGLGSEDKARVAESDARIKVLEESFKNQQQALEEIKAQLQSTPEQRQPLTEKLQILEEKLKEQEVQLSELKARPPTTPGPLKLSHIPAFINSFATVRVKFDQPGHYTFNLFQSSPNRRSGILQGSVIVLP